MAMEEVVIVGGGIAGMATAVALKRVGIRALVLERSEVLRTTGAALTLSANAWLALDALGVSHKLTSLYSPLLKGWVTTVSTGNTQEITFPRSQNGDSRTIHRKNLLAALADELPSHCIRFSSKITAIDVQQQEGAPIYNLHLQDGTTLQTKVVIGCDGVHSVVGKWLGLKEAVHSGRWAVRGLAVYPQGHGYEHGVQQFVDPGKRASFVPLNHSEIYWGFTFQGHVATTDPRMIQKELIENHAKNFPSAFLDVLQHADLSSLNSAPLLLRHPWHIIFGSFRKGNVTVAGDAMHPMTPDLAQGGCSALEDAVVLGRHLANSVIKNGAVSDGIGEAIDGYVEERRWRAAGLVTASFLSGWVQQDGSNWFMKFLRDAIFYRFFSKLLLVVQYDCGKLPIVSSQGKDNSSKED